MLETTPSVVIPNCRTKDERGNLVRIDGTSSRSSHHPDKPRRRKSKEEGGRMNGLWCTSGQRSPTSSFDTTSPYDIPHLARPSTAAPSVSSKNATPSIYQNGVNYLASNAVNGVDCKLPEHSEKDASTPAHPRNLPPSGCSSRPSSSSATKIAQRNPAQDGAAGCDTQNSESVTRSSNPIAMIPKSRMFRSLSSFSLKSFSLRRKDTPSKPAAIVQPEVNSHETGSRMEQSRKRVGGSLPGDDRLNLSNSTAATDEEIQRKRTHTQVAQRLSRLSRSFRRRRSADRATTDLKNQDPCSESSSTTSSTSASSTHQAIVLYGTTSRGRRSSFKISISAPSFDSNGTPSAPDKCIRKSGCDFPVIPIQLSLPDGVRLMKILKLEQYVTNKWISGMAVSDKNELVLVDLRAAYLVDDWGNLIRTIGSKGSDRLIEPIGVTQGPEGRLVFSDHAQQNVKVFTNRGSHIRTVTDFCLANIAGVACNRSTGQIFVAGTDRKKIFINGDGQTRTIPPDRNIPTGGAFNSAVFKHPFSVAYNPISQEIIVGDDYDQSVMAVSIEGELMWRFCPPTQDGERQFFPSSVCVDQDGTVFVADLYNGKVCMLDSKGQFIRTLLSREFGLSGNPGAIATDGKGHIYVADEERTVKIFQYKKIV